MINKKSPCHCMGAGWQDRKGCVIDICIVFIMNASIYPEQLYYLFACFKIHKNNVICDLFTHFVVSWHKEM